MKRAFLKSLAAVLACAAASCTAVQAQTTVPKAGHVFLVMEENHSYSSVIGNTAMPYLNSLAQNYGLATQYYANTHPSIGNYFMLTTGQILTNDDSRTPSNFPVSADNIVRHFLNANVTWKSYAESLPSVGYTGSDVSPYVVHHNPFAYFTDVQNSTMEKLNLVPFTQFQTDLANGTLPQFSYIIPNVNDDAHNGTLQQADSWLKTNIAPVLASPAFQNNGLMVIVFDESYDSDTASGGGHVAMLVLSPQGKGSYKSTTHYQHQSTLRLMMDALGISSFPGAAASAPEMSEFFGTSAPAPAPAPAPTPTPTPAPAPAPAACAPAGTGVTVCSPAAGSSASSPVQFTAAAASGTSHAIAAMKIYVDGSSVYAVQASSINTAVTMANGTHNVTVKAWDSGGAVYSKALTVTVGSATITGGGGTCASAALNTVTICAPAAGSSVGSPVHMVAASSSQYGVSAMQIYVDYALKYTVNAANIDTYLSLASGNHRLDMKAWTTAGTSFMSNVTVSVP